ncbi:cytochrome o ubiquinol oxidase [Escherichia coli DEC14B]|nr:cytochrome o ubiquinol oxidase [Escherichia coli DEC14B]
MQSLYDWIQQQMKTLSRHSDTAKAFAYLLKQWDALNVYCSNGWWKSTATSQRTPYGEWP